MRPFLRLHFNKLISNLLFNSSGWDESERGYISYVAGEETEEVWFQSIFKSYYFFYQNCHLS